MTGYGAAQEEQEGVSYRLEIRSLNNRYLKTNIKLPEHLQILEAELEKLLRQRLHRGSISYTLYFKDGSAETAAEINVPVIARYLEQLRGLADDRLQLSVDLAALLQLPGVCQPAELEEEARRRHWEVIQRLTDKALEQLIRMREVEGQALRDDLLAHCQAIRGHLSSVQERCPAVVEEYGRRLQQRVNTLLTEAQLDLDQDTLIREVAVFADRCDVSEEIARLSSHLDQFVAVCNAREYAGRKLDFLAQELLREANTIASKANDTVVSRHTVEIKSLIDRIKEQVQNVE